MDDPFAIKKIDPQAGETTNGHARQLQKQRKTEPKKSTAMSSQAPQEPQGHTQEEMLLEAAFGEEVAAGEVALETFCERAIRSDKRLSDALNEEMPLVYAAIVRLQGDGKIDEFLEHKKIKRHGNARNPLSPVVKALARKNGDNARAWLSKIAAMMALARHEKIAPSKFPEWRSDWSLEKAAKKWRGLQRSSGKSAQSGEQTQKMGKGLLASLQAAWDAVSSQDKQLFLARNGLSTRENA
jgi:hypothetical protein